MDKELTGIQKIAKQYGRISINGEMHVWDYSEDCYVPESSMPIGSVRWQISQESMWNKILDE